MTFWDYLDRHEIIGTCLVMFAIFWVALTIISFAEAWAVRKQSAESKR